MSPFEEAVIDTAHTFGWKVAHFRAARTKHGWATPVAADGKGFPDLVLVSPGRTLFRELKSGRDKLSPEQREWGEVLTLGGADWAEWRDTDMATIVAELSNGRGQLQ